MRQQIVLMLSVTRTNSAYMYVVYIYVKLVWRGTPSGCAIKVMVERAAGRFTTARTA